MSLAVVGSIAFDSVKTPFGERSRMLGGSAVHFSLAASFFTDVRVVGPVGDDFGDDEYAVLHARGVNTDDIEHVAGGRTFFWAGHYEYDLNSLEDDALKETAAMTHTA
jgi:sugar/nucleoside kinase (ribokinase family)